MRSRVMPGSLVTMERRVPVKRLNSVDLPTAGAADKFSGVDDRAAARENRLGRAFDLNALEHGVVHAHVMRFGADNFFVVGIEQDQVGVRADGDGPFARVEAKETIAVG